MELPPITVATSLPVALPPVVSATVESVLAPNTYALNVQGLMLQLSLDLLLAPGDTLSFRVREQTPSKLILEVLPRPTEPMPALPPIPDLPQGSEEIVREFVRMRAPLDRDTVEQAMRVSRDPSTRQAAAFLAAHGFEPTAPLVESLARLTQPPVPPETRAPLLAPLQENLQSLVAETPEEIPIQAPRLAGPPSREFEESLRKLLDASPRLRVLDRLLEALAATRPDDDPSISRNETLERLGRALQLIRSVTSETLEKVLRELPRLPREALQELRGRLLDMERQEISSLPDLAAARAARGTVLDAADRLTDLRLVNQLSQLRHEGVTLLEIPVRAEGKLQYVPVRMRREKARSGDPASARFGITLDLDLSRIGAVSAHLESAGKMLRVRFRVRDRAVQKHVAGSSGNLVDALKAQGFEPTVAAEVGHAIRTAIFDVFASPGEAISIDIHA